MLLTRKMASVVYWLASQPFIQLPTKVKLIWLKNATSRDRKKIKRNRIANEQKPFLSSDQVLNPYREYSNLESGLCKWKRQRKKNEIIIGVIGE